MSPCFYNFSAILNFALLERGFSKSSSSDGSIGFFVISLIFGVLPQTHMGKSLGHVHPKESSLNAFLIILSSKEWKDITAIRPPGTIFSAADAIIGDITSSSAFTSILIA